MTVITKAMIMTYRGHWIDPQSPDPEQIDIYDIAHSLSNQCRFTGHTNSFYSVAQHSCHVADLCSARNSLGGLLHDGTEAYLSDIARPIKKQPGFGESYTQIEDALMDAICKRFGLWTGPMPMEIVEADIVMLRTEMEQLMPRGILVDEAESPVDTKATRLTIDPWAPEQAQEEFLMRFLKDRTDSGEKPQACWYY